MVPVEQASIEADWLSFRSISLLRLDVRIDRDPDLFGSNRVALNLDFQSLDLNPDLSLNPVDQDLAVGLDLADLGQLLDLGFAVPDRLGLVRLGLVRLDLGFVVLGRTIDCLATIVQDAMKPNDCLRSHGSQEHSTIVRASRRAMMVVLRFRYQVGELRERHVFSRDRH